MKRADHSYIINGVNIISDAGVYNAAGAEFDYRRIDDAIDSSDENTEGVTEWITATGPIREEIHLMVFATFLAIICSNFQYQPPIVTVYSLSL